MKTLTHEGVIYKVFDHLYAVSKDGKLLRGLAPHTPIKHPMGYLIAGRQRLVHRMVAICWLEKPEPANHVHHKNGDKTDNRASNLEWVTPQEHIGKRHTRPKGVYRWTEESRDKLRAYRTGRKDSPKTRAKKAAILARVSPKRVCEVNGVRYHSIPAAGRALGMHQSTVRQRCLSKYFPNFKLLA